MKRLNYQKGVRVLLALLFFVPILLFFLDFTNKMPVDVHKFLHIQLLPAVLGGMFGIVAVLLIMTYLFGRIYCSAICPAGILQDIINRLFCIGKKKKKGVRRFSYHKPMNWLRYSILALTVVTTALGFSGLCLLLDPYSNFGRIAANLFRPAVMWGNNVLADWLMKMDNYSLFHVTISTVSIAGLISAIVALVVFIVMVIFRGRLFCNTLCPVGALLSLVSRYSQMRISFDKEACNHCGNCERTCKAEAINAKEMTVDSSRCVDCFNCVSSCSKGGLQYRFKPAFRKENDNLVPVPDTGPQKDRHSQSAADTDGSNAIPCQARERTSASNSRRTFLATGVTVAATLPVVSAIADGVGQAKGHGQGNGHGKKKGRKKWPPITPPGSLNLERFKDKCTGCHICVVKCPSQVLRPAGLEYGFDYLLKPRMAYISSYCNYECTICSEVCPAEALKPISVEEKKSLQVGIATFFINRCIVKTEGTDCGACSEHCPTQAVHMVPYEGTLTIPEVNPDLCVGCGGCESICPVRPMRAIIVKANTVHQTIVLPEEEEVKNVEVDDFGF